MEFAVSTEHSTLLTVFAVDDDVLFAALLNAYDIEYFFLFSVAMENSISLFLRGEFIIIIQMNVGAA